MSGADRNNTPGPLSESQMEHSGNRHPSGMISHERRCNPDVEVVSDLIYSEGRTSLLALVSSATHSSTEAKQMA